VRFVPYSRSRSTPSPDVSFSHSNRDSAHQLSRSDSCVSMRERTDMSDRQKFVEVG
jgi:hypothetical protein